METNGKAFLHHWRWAAEKGLMNRNTADGIRSAGAQVLSVLDEKEREDVTALDVEAVLKRFENLKAKEFKPKVLETYKSRFRTGVASFRAYLKDPGGWKSGIVERPPRVKEGDGVGRATVEASVQPLPGTGLVEYPFPLREGQTARLVLPRDLKTAEVKRLSAFMSTLVADYDSNEQGNGGRR
jgi:hypothetical protein